MKASSFITIILIVGLVYLFSYVHSTPTDRTPNGFNIPTDKTPVKYEPTDKTPAIAKFKDLVSRRDNSMINHLANTGIIFWLFYKMFVMSIFFISFIILQIIQSRIFYLAAIGYVAKNYPLEISRVSRQLSPSGLDMEETMKVGKKSVTIDNC